MNRINKSNPPTKRISSRELRDSWFPYYAAFPTNWAMDMMLKNRSAACVLDPWNGSGSTTLAASLLGVPSYGFDLNPVASILALAKLVQAKDFSWINRARDRLVNRLIRCQNFYSTENFSVVSGYNAGLVSQLRRIVNDLVSGTPCGNVYFSMDGIKYSPASCFFIACIWQGLRNCLPKLRSANPSWTKLSSHENIHTESLIAQIDLILADCYEDLLQAPIPKICASIGVGDSKKISIDSESVDMIIGSPPYLTRIDYFIMTRLELEWLNFPLDFRKKLMGTTQIRSGVRDELQKFIRSLPPKTKHILERVVSHSSTGSLRYYAPTMVQYFSDLRSSIVEIFRVLKPGGLAHLVVQTSFYKEIEIDLPLLLCEIAKFNSLTVHCVDEYPIDCYFDRVRSGRWRNRKYKESVVSLRKKRN